MSTSDRELLELAARAAGIGPVIGFAAESCELMIGTRNNMRYWRPLTDDGDALRLAVKLGLDITFYNGYQEVHADSASGDQLSPAIEEYGEDRFSATRRAIVRSAAEIGRTM